MNSPVYRFVVLIAVLSLVCIGTLHAQTAVTGAITGYVKDPSGAVLTEATVEATNTATGVTDQTVTNLAGLYRFPSVLPGTYSITVTKAGFEKFIRQDVTVDAGTAVPIDVNVNSRCGNRHSDRYRSGSYSSDRYCRSQSNHSS